ncbi:MAG: hypothetical protein M3Q11_01460 [Pseudomonadota bacterium]|nr:hypothetical protein [Pseudomonadota bacterium]
MRMRTQPERPSTARITSAQSGFTGMQSDTCTRPSATSISDCTTSESSRYLCRSRVGGSQVCSAQWPCSCVPSSDAKHAGESKRGRQSQSMQPDRSNSAAPRQFLRNAWSAIAEDM